MSPAQTAARIRDALPPGGLFAGREWRISPEPFPLGEKLAEELESFGRVLLQFYRAANLLHRKSEEGGQPPWVADWLNRGKPSELLRLQRHPAFKHEPPRVIRPDLLLTEDGFAVTELDSVPGGIGLTAWLNRVYSENGAAGAEPIGGAEGMPRGFASIFGGAERVHIVVSEESAVYRPEMEWLAEQMKQGGFKVRDAVFDGFAPGDAVYRFFELFDLDNVPAAGRIFEAALRRDIRLTPPPKPLFEEKMLLALLWNGHLRGFWRRELGDAFFRRLLHHVPRTWVVDPAPLPPHAAIPGLELTDWRQLKTLSQRERGLVLKISGFSEKAWGSRGVFIGPDLSGAEWSAAVDEAVRSFPQSPYVLQQYSKPKRVEAAWFDSGRNELVSMPGRVRLCPYYFVAGEGDGARAVLGGVLATICPADKKIIHGMKDAILAPCRI